MPRPKRRPRDPLFERVRRDLVFYPVPDGWSPDLVEKAWLEEVDALTPEQIRQMDRFAPVEVTLNVVPPEELEEL